VNNVKCQDDQRKNGNAIPFLISTQFILFAWMRSEIEMRENGFIFSFLRRANLLPAQSAPSLYYDPDGDVEGKIV
jgi:hypothetical protein